MAKKRYKSQRCPNCGATFGASSEHINFCPACGQENHDLNIPFRHLLSEVFETVFHFDTKSVRTVKALVFRPGFLTSEFIRGRRARYVTPIRLYIFISFFFFLLLSFSTPHRDEQAGDAAQQPVKGGFGISFIGINSTELRGLQEHQIDSLMQSRNIPMTAWNRYVVHQMARTVRGSGREFILLIIKTFSYMVFVLMPFFGYLVYVFHRKQDHRYIGTLVFSLHFHSFAFLALSLLLLLGRIPGMSPVTLLAPIVLAMYLYLCLRSVYGQSRISALLKTGFIGGLHVVSVALLLIVTVFASVVLF